MEKQRACRKLVMRKMVKILLRKDLSEEEKEKEKNIIK